MVQKALIVFLSCIVSFIAAAPSCPAPTAGGPAVACVFVPDCQFAENGTLTPLATQCDNQLADSDCAQLFPCDPSAPAPACNPQADPVTDPTDQDYPYVRAPACTDPDLQNIAYQCAKQCAICCLSPEYNCDDDIKSPVDCELNKGKCKDANWTDIMAQYCPKTCGLCTDGTCRDLNSGCNTMTALCKNVDWVSYMNTNCARTCDVCTTSTNGSTGCTDNASNCAPNANLCNDNTYRDLMQQQCCATCKGTSGSPSASCSDSDPSCSNWVRNGFCTSTFYNSDQKRQYCGRSCNLC